MPTYQYRCTECGQELEALQKFTDDPLTVCPRCQGVLRKVFSPVGVVFKGSGFYKTDSRAKRSSSGAAAGASKESDAASANGSDSKESGAAKESASRPGGSDGSDSSGSGKQSASPGASSSPAGRSGSSGGSGSSGSSGGSGSSTGGGSKVA